MTLAPKRQPTAIPEDVLRRRIPLPDVGIEIAIQDWGGEGPLVLLHHANGFCAGMWAEVASALRDRYHFVALDARGHGDSGLPTEGATAETLAWSVLVGDLICVAEALLAETGAPRIELGVGQSFGGTLTFAAAADRPDLFGQLLLLDPVIFPAMDAEAGRRHAEESGLSKRARRRRADWPNREAARAYCLEKPMFESWTDGALDLYLEEGLREREAGGVELKCSGAVEGQIFEGPASLNIFEKSKAVRVPTQIVWAKQGNFQRAMYEALLAPVPDAQIEDAEVGHLMLMERPDVVMAYIERLLPR